MREKEVTDGCMREKPECKGQNHVATGILSGHCPEPETREKARRKYPQSTMHH